MSAEATIEEARFLARKVVERERGRVGGDVDRAIQRASSLYGVEESALRSLRYRSRTLKFVKAHVLERLRQVDEWLEATADRERQITQDVAETLERRGSPAAGVARKIADLAEQEGR
jgi:hypothetical protein